jgi:ADP-heptose:LPS heptosyltransferase
LADPDRILIVRLSHLGDVVHALGLVHALHAAYPRARIGWAVQSEFAGLLRGMEGVDELFEFRRRGGPGAWRELAHALRAFRADWTVDAQGNAKSALASWLSRAPRRLAPHRRDWQEPWAAWTVREHAPALAPPARHAMERMEVLARALVPKVELPLRTDAGLTGAERAAGERELAARAPAGAGLVLLHLSSPGDVRGWPLERWRELALALAEQGRAVLVLSGPTEAEAGRELARELAHARIAHWVEQRGLRELAAVFAAAAGRGARLVACDSGPMHLAAAHGLALVALEGPQAAARTGPWPLAGVHAVVRSSREPECAPCLKHVCRNAAGPVCMRELDVERVLAALHAARG